MRRLVRAVSLSALLWASGCTESETPKTVISVVVDTSGSWLSTFDDNAPIEDLLRVTGLGLSESVTRSQGPVEIRYYVITATSFTENVRCQMTYTNSLSSNSSVPSVAITGATNPPRTTNKPAFVRRYLAEDCPKMILTQIDASNDGTDIEGALFLASEDMKSRNAPNKLIVIISDMVADSQVSSPNWRIQDTGATPLLLMMRPVGQDGKNPAQFQERQEEWLEKTSEWGFCPFARTESNPSQQTISNWADYGLRLNNLSVEAIGLSCRPEN